ncbi:outer membrane beta-barrel protein [Mucilaginibacter sp.]|uniref:outer membrane beta-barrel protein n=1 Tax=Mucilaginibacter sp. TaxID=1882438 RepID=UPI00261745A1|nr:outer membrane beta-barrel protein [Mucilaginibacter sp.]
MKNNYGYFIYFLFIVICFAQNSSAQNKITSGRISGNITDSISQEPVRFATLSLRTAKDSLAMTTVSKADGSFSMDNIRPQTYRLVIISIGYERKIANIDLANTKEINLGRLGLTRLTQSLKEVQITADRPIVQQKTDRIIYDMQADPESKVTSVLGMIHKIPFLSVDADDNVLMKGNTSFKVLINGKESGMFTNNLKEILKSMPATNILRIEVITTPPSKYDAEGLAGIINIITNRKIAGGYKGNINLNEGLPNSGPGAGGSVTAQNGKFGINAFGGGSAYTNPATNYETRRTAFGGNPSLLQQAGYNSGSGRNGYFGTDLSYEIDSLHLLSADFNISGNKKNGFTYQNSRLKVADGTLLQGYDLDNHNHSNGSGFDAALNYQLGFKSDKNTLLTFSYRYSQTSSHNAADISFSNPFGYPTPDYRQPDNEQSREQTVQVDYTKPIHKVIMEAGVKAIFRNSRSDFEYLSLDSASNQFENDAALGNTFNYAQDVFGVYNSYRFSLKKYNFSAGLRAEETYIKANFISTGTFLDKTYFNILPSLAISRPFAGNRSLNFGYTQRILRPGIGRLNPFVDRSNPNFIIAGNPNLRPVIMNDLQLGYSTTAGKNISLFVAADYTFFNNLELPVISFDPATQVTITTYENNGKGGGVGVNINLNYSPVKFYNLSINGNALQFFVNGTGNIAASRMHILAGHVSLSNSFRFDGGWSGNVNADYQSRMPHSIQGVSNAYFSTSVSVNKELVKDKLYVSGAVNNPFTKFRNNVVTTTSPDFFQVDENQKYFRYATFSLNYKFGRLKNDIKKSRKNIKNDDVGNGAF